MFHISSAGTQRLFTSPTAINHAKRGDAYCGWCVRALQMTAIWIDTLFARGRRRMQVDGMFLWFSSWMWHPAGSALV